MLVPETEIIVSHGGAVLSRTTVQPGDYVIGCEAECDVRVEARLVSRRHAQLTVNFDHVLIEDLGSSNGTFVNGQPVNEPTRLWPNQRIEIGEATIELRRVKTLPPPDASFGPVVDTVQRLLPEELLRERKYAIGRVVAEGGMGAILDAKEAATDRKVAMKVMLSQSNAGNVQRFIEEAQVTAQLEHPNIVPVHELGVDANDQVFYTMKFVRGDTLREVLDRLTEGHAQTVEKYSLAVLLTIFQKICDALAFAHSRGVIHRDLKPANIMLGDFGEVLVMDWGLAKRLNRNQTATPRGTGPRPPVEEESPFLTQPGAVLGTPQYMAPEQAQGEVDALDARTDMYSLGAILFHVLALRAPVKGRTAREVVDKVARGDIEELAPRAGAQLTHLPDGRIPASLAAVTRQAMAFAPAARYQTVADLQADLAAYQTGFATRAEKAGAWKQLTLLVRRHRVVATVAVTSLLLLTAVSGLYTFHAVQQRKLAEQARDDKEHERQRADDARTEAELAKANLETALAQAKDASKRATDKASEAEMERARARGALEELQKSAPAFFDLAQTRRQEQKFEEALTKLDSAISLEPDKPEYLLVQAHLLQATERLRRAAEIYQRILGLRAEPADRLSAEINLALCEEILRANGSAAALSDASRGKLVAALLSQQRGSDAVVLDRKTRGGAQLARVAIMSKLSDLLRYDEAFNWKNRLGELPNKSFRLDLTSLQISRVPDLTGLAISELILDGTALTSLDSLKGSRLEKLWINRTRISDLRPLAGLPIVELSLQFTDVVNLSPLRDLPALKRLNVSNAPLTDLSPLQGLSIEELYADSTNVRDLSAVRKLPLKVLTLANLRFAIDLSPLTDCRTLVKLVLPKTSMSADLLGIRALPELRRLTEPTFPDLVKPEDHWQQRPLNAREVARLQAAMTALVGGPGLLAEKPRPVLNEQGLLELNLRGFPVTDLQPLRGLPIAVLDLHAVPVTDFSPLAETPVRTLILGGRFSAAQPPVNFQTLKKVTTLTHLTIDDSTFRNLADLAGLKLKTLNIPDTDVSDLSPLSGTRIEELQFPGTPVLDIRPMLQMPLLRSASISESVTNSALLDHLPNFIYGPKDKTVKPLPRTKRARVKKP